MNPDHGEPVLSKVMGRCVGFAFAVNKERKEGELSWANYSYGVI